MLVKHFAPRRKVVRQAPGPLLDKALHLFTTFLYPVKYYLDESKGHLNESKRLSNQPKTALSSTISSTKVAPFSGIVHLINA